MTILRNAFLVLAIPFGFITVAYGFILILAGASTFGFTTSHPCGAYEVCNSFRLICALIGGGVILSGIGAACVAWFFYEFARRVRADKIEARPAA